MKRIAIAMIEPVGGHGGMDIYDTALCGALTQSGVNVVLHTSELPKRMEKYGFPIRYTYAGIFGKYPSWIRGLRYVLSTMKAVWSAVIERQSICHFHIFHVGILQLISLLLAKLSGRRVVITAHDVESFFENPDVLVLSRLAYRLANRVIAHNRISQLELIEKIGLLPEKVIVIPFGNFIHTILPPPTRQEARRKLGVPNKAKVILFFGQIKAVKGLDILLEAVSVIAKTHPEVVLLIAGRPWKSEFSVYEKKINELGIRQRCNANINYIPDTEVPLYYAATDIVVLPYRRIYQSAVLLMAMSYCRAVLVSDLPGFTEIITNGENGFVFKQGDRIDLVAQLNNALDNDATRDKMAEKGYQHARMNFDWQDIGDRTANVYSGLLG